MKSRYLAILQPLYPHYRDDFFSKLRSEINGLDLFSFHEDKSSSCHGFQINIPSRYIKALEYKGLLIYTPISLLQRKYDTLVLMLHFGHITTWLLLLTKILHRKKIVLWGQGISVKRYLNEEINPDWKLKLMIKMADSVWIYMDKEYEQWKRIYPSKPIVSLGNSLSGIEEMINYHPACSLEDLRNKYNIRQQRVFIFCARFENNYRRVDLLEDIIKRLDAKENGFVIIGAGKNKPDFSKYMNVYDFGALYDSNVKRELFALSDLYLQPGWVGLSIVEAMAYGKPVCTFRRSKETLQCVEYSYIKDGENGMIFNDLEDSLSRLAILSHEKIYEMGKNAKETARSYTPDRMVNNAISVL